MDYSFIKGLGKFAKYFLLFGAPVIVDKLIVAYPDWAQLSLGGLLVLLTNWLKVYVAPKLGWGKRV